MERLKLLLWDAITTHGLYIFLAVAGVTSAFVTMFVDPSGQVSVKWLIFFVFVALCIVATLVHTVFAAAGELNEPDTFRIIKQINDSGLILIRGDVKMFTTVSLSVSIDGYEQVCALGFVQNVQAKQVASVKLTLRVSSAADGLDLVKYGHIKSTLDYRDTKGIMA